MKARSPVTHISQSHPDRVEVRGRDLTELMGRLSFIEYFHLLLTGEEPTDEQRYFLDLLLVSIAEHGMMPTNVAAGRSPANTVLSSEARGGNPRFGAGRS